MKMLEALKVIRPEPVQPPFPGFMVHFDKVEAGRPLESDYFPEVLKGEEPVATEKEAWELAKDFAAKSFGRYVNIYVIRRCDFTPVPGYEGRKIKNR